VREKNIRNISVQVNFILGLVAVSYHGVLSLYPVTSYYDSSGHVTGSGGQLSADLESAAGAVD